MDIKVSIKNGYIEVTEPMVQEVYIIDTNEETGEFYLRTKYGDYSGIGISEYKDLCKAIADVKGLIKNYFVDRCEPNPTGF